MNNKGLQISISRDLIRRQNINWKITANATHYSNKLPASRCNAQRAFAGLFILKRRRSLCLLFKGFAGWILKWRCFMVHRPIKYKYNQIEKDNK
ncbi:hypothetical protein CS542_08315 [Pedobacter sp. IW39]|nr:hypothetical protein CS542_08315 [Pedobacter sp. IW39]